MKTDRDKVTVGGRILWQLLKKIVLRGTQIVDDLRNNTILFVDDDKDILLVYKKMLCSDSEFQNLLSDDGKVQLSRKDDYRILLAESGEKAISIIENEQRNGRQVPVGFFDFILANGINGIETINRIKKIDEDMICAVVTGYSDRTIEELRSAFNTPGDFHYFNKPFSASELRQYVNNLFEKWRVKKREQEFNRLILKKSNLLQENKNNLERILKERTELIIRQKDIIAAQCDFSTRLHKIKTIDDVINETLKFINEMLLSSRISIMLEEGGFLKIRGSIGLEHIDKRAVKIPIGSNVSGTVFKDKRPFLTKDLKVLRKLTDVINNEFTSFISIPLVLSSRNAEEKVIGVINVTNRFDNMPFKYDDLKLLTYVADTLATSIENISEKIRLELNKTEAVKKIVLAYEEKSNFFSQHSINVSNYSKIIAKEMGFSEEEVNLIGEISLLHDIGKINIPDAICESEKELNNEEFEIIKNHPVKGYDLLTDLSGKKDNINIAVLQHHERLDGSGYPNGLHSNQINLFARILAVADSFCAMTSDRPYKKKKSYKEAAEELLKCSGKQLDKQCIDLLLSHLKSKEFISLTH